MNKPVVLITGAPHGHRSRHRHRLRQGMGRPAWSSQAGGRPKARRSRPNFRRLGRRSLVHPGRRPVAKDEVRRAGRSEPWPGSAGSTPAVKQCRYRGPAWPGRRSDPSRATARHLSTPNVLGVLLSLKA